MEHTFALFNDHPEGAAPSYERMSTRRPVDTIDRSECSHPFPHTPCRSVWHGSPGPTRPLRRAGPAALRAHASPTGGGQGAVPAGTAGRPDRRLDRAGFARCGKGLSHRTAQPSQKRGVLVPLAGLAEPLDRSRGAFPGHTHANQRVPAASRAVRLGEERRCGGVCARTPQRPANSIACGRAPHAHPQDRTGVGRCARARPHRRRRKQGRVLCGTWTYPALCSSYPKEAGQPVVSGRLTL